MKLTEQDFVREIGWVLYSNKDTLPASVDIDDESPLDVLPTFVLEALVRDWNDPSIEQHFAAPISISSSTYKRLLLGCFHTPTDCRLRPQKYRRLNHHQ